MSPAGTRLRQTLVTALAPGSLLRLAAPLVLSFWMRAAVTLVDTIYASFVGDAAVAAVGLTIPFEFLMIAAWVGLSTGLTACLARAMAANEHRRFEQYLAVGRRLVLTLTPLFTLAGGALWLAAPHLGLEPRTAAAFRVYGTLLVGGSAFTTFWSILPDSLVKAHQDTRSTMWAGIWTNTINVSLNTLFVFGLGWGVVGIALSTVLGRLGGLVYALARAAAHERRRRAAISGPPGEPDRAPWRAVLRLALPAAVVFALAASEGAVFNALLAMGPNPTESIAAFSIYTRVLLFMLQPVIATSVAVLPFAARRFGQGDGPGIRRGLHEALAAAACYALAVVGPVMLFVRGPLARALAESQTTARYTSFTLSLVPLACLASAPFLLCRPAFEAMHRPRPGLAVALLRYAALTAPLAWAGIAVARRLQLPPLYGIAVSGLVVAALASLAIYVWLRRTVDELSP